MKAVTLIAASIVLFVGQAAMAGEAEIRKECGQDYKKFCSDVRPGGGRIIECLRDNQEKLSPGCKEVFKDAKKG